MLRRFAGLDTSPKPPPIEPPAPQLIVPTDARIIIPMPCCGRIITEHLELDAPAMTRLFWLLEEAKRYRNPPQDLIDQIDEAMQEVTAPAFTRIEEILQHFMA